MVAITITVQSTTTPSRFNFLKEGLLLPSHNRRLFAAVFSIILFSTCLLIVIDHVAVQPLSDEILLDAKALNSTDPSSSTDFLPLIQKIQNDTGALLLTGAKALNSTDPGSPDPDFLQLIQKIQHDIWALLLTIAASLVFSVIIKSAVQIVVLFAAVATYSGELHTFGSLLGKIRTQLKGPLLTLAFVYALKIAYWALLAAMTAVLLVFLAIKDYSGLFFVVFLLLVAFVVFLVYFSLVCSLSVLVAVAEPGCHGAGALARAWRLIMKGKRRQAVRLICVTILLTTAVSRVRRLAKTCALTDKAAGLLLGLLYIVLTSAEQLFVACAKAAFYYECKRSTEAPAPAEYVMVSTKAEQFDA